MADRASRIAALLQEASETHHLVFRIVDGEDPGWASWYAEWAIEHSELPQILGAAPVRSELVWLLVGLDKDYAQAGSSAPWPEHYAPRIVERLASTGA
jgi:hypothetical protein